MYSQTQAKLKAAMANILENAEATDSQLIDGCGVSGMLQLANQM